MAESRVAGGGHRARRRSRRHGRGRRRGGLRARRALVRSGHVDVGDDAPPSPDGSATGLDAARHRARDPRPRSRPRRRDHRHRRRARRAARARGQRTDGARGGGRPLRRAVRAAPSPPASSSCSSSCRSSPSARLADAVGVVEEVGLPSGAVLVDTLHLAAPAARPTTSRTADRAAALPAARRRAAEPPASPRRVARRGAARSPAARRGRAAARGRWRSSQVRFGSCGQALMQAFPDPTQRARAIAGRSATMYLGADDQDPQV